MNAPRAVVVLWAAFVVAMLVAPSPSHAVDECCVNGTCLSATGFPYDQSQCHNVGGLCGCEIHGTNCQFRLTADVTTSSNTDCLTLGAGVTFDLNGHSITCTDDNCGSAILNTTSSGSSGAVHIEDGFISGCWQRGVNDSGGTNSDVTGMNVDLGRVGGGSCNLGGVLSAGIFTPRGTTSDTVVSNAFTCIYAQPGEDIIDCVLHDCLVAVSNLGASSSTVNLTNIQLLNNTYSLKNNNPGVYIPNGKNLSMQNTSGGCECINASNVCVTNIADCVDFAGTTGGKSFIGDAILP